MEPRCLLALIINEFPIATQNSTPAFMTSGPDNNIWFTEANGNKIAQLNPSTHTIAEFPITTPNSSPQGIISGPDGNLWFTESSANQIAMINPTSKAITEFAVPTLNSVPVGIAAGSDGNIWFTETTANQIGRLNLTTHVVTEFLVPTAKSAPLGITAGPDQNIWFTEVAGNKIGVMNLTTLAITEFAVPTLASNPFGITTGPDQNLWFAEENGNKIGQFNPTKKVFAEFPVLTPNSAPEGVATGPDGNLWFTEAAASKIGDITPTSHVVSEFPTPTPNSLPLLGIVSGADGNLWFAEDAANQIGQALLNPNQIGTNITMSAAPNPSLLGQQVFFTATVTAGSGNNPNGTVTFFIDGQPQSPVLLLLTNGKELAKFSSSSLAPGLHKITAVYNGLGLWSPSTTSLTQIVSNSQIATTTQLSSSLNPSFIRQQVTFTATVTPAVPGNPIGTVTFFVDGVAQASIPLAIVGGKDQASFSTEALTLGSHQVVAVYNSGNGFKASTSNLVTQVVNNAPGDGPRVKSLKRFGIHSQPTTLVLTFNEALDPARAQNLANYSLVTAVLHGHTVVTGQAIPINQAVYNSAAHTVTLFPAQQLNVHLLYQLTVNGTAPDGLTDTLGRLLDGNGSGKQGSNYVALITARNFAGQNKI
jgi:streptogramin lyase